jgi:hypothetical protein
MRTLIVYESMYGNTRHVAEAIAAGIRPLAETKVVPVGRATPEMVEWAEVMVVGGPTHAHGMSRSSTRYAADEAAAKPDSRLTLEEGFAGPGVRDWLDELPAGNGRRAAAFDTRLKGPAVFTGRAASGIARGLERHGFVLASEPESFLVTRQTVLVDGELERARAWGTQLVGGVVAVD